MQHFERGQERVDATHEALEKDHLGQTNGEHFEIARKVVQVVEVLQLHSGAEVEHEVLEILTLVGQVVQHVGRYQIDGQLDVLERHIKAVTKQVQEVVEISNLYRVLEFGSQFECAPQLAILGQIAPEFADESAFEYFVRIKKREYVNEKLLGQRVYIALLK